MVDSKSGKAWFDGYNGQETVVLEEFYGWLSITTLLSLINTTPYRIPVKGGSRSFVARRVFITSNTPPSKWYNQTGSIDSAVMAALSARLSPPIGHSFFLGYGPQKNWLSCPCQERSTCNKAHDSEIPCGAIKLYKETC